VQLGESIEPHQYVESGESGEDVAGAYNYSNKTPTNNAMLTNPSSKGTVIKRAKKGKKGKKGGIAISSATANILKNNFLK